MKKILILLFLLACTSVPKVIFDSGAVFNVEVAKTDQEKSKGLMFREQMPKDDGMLFFFDDESPKTFWMKNTLLPLDMIFIDADMVVVEIKANVPPCKEDPCPTYESEPAKYVLEINGGVAEKKNINIGDKITLK